MSCKKNKCYSLCFVSRPHTLGVSGLFIKFLQLFPVCLSVLRQRLLLSAAEKRRTLLNPLCPLRLAVAHAQPVQQDGGECGTEGKASLYRSLTNRRFPLRSFTFKPKRRCCSTAEMRGAVGLQRPTKQRGREARTAC